MEITPFFRDFVFIEATPRNRASFIKNFWKSFQHIGRNGDLLNIKEYHSLVLLLCADFPFQVLQRTAKIILIDDAMDCLVSFSDFLYAFQMQFYYQEFLDKCFNIYKSIGNDLQYKMDPSTQSVKEQGEINIRIEAKSIDVPQDVSSKRFMEKLSKEIFNKRAGSSFSCPPEDAIREILMSASRVSFYGFLIALTKSETVNKSIGVLPDKPSLIDLSDEEISIVTPRSTPARSRSTASAKKSGR